MSTDFPEVLWLFEERPISDDHPRDYAPRGYKAWNRYAGSHIGLKQFTKLTKKLIPRLTTEAQQEWLQSLRDLNPALNPKMSPDRINITINLLKSHLNIS